MLSFRKLLSLKFIFIADVLFSSCGNDDDTSPATEKIFEVEMDASYFEGGYDHWLVISNTEGEIVDAAPLTKDSSVEFEAIKGETGETITVTLLRHSFTSNRYHLDSYVAVDKGGKMVLRSSPSGEGAEYTTVDFDFPGLPSSQTWVMFTSMGSRVGGASGSSSVSVEITTPLSDLFISVTGAHEPRYLELDLETDSQRTFNFPADFKTYDHVFSQLPLSLASISITGLKEIAAGAEAPVYGVHVQSLYFSGNFGGLQAGYNDGYDLYSTGWSTKTQNDASISYSKVGEAPSEDDFEVPFFDFSVVNSEINSFEYTTGSDLHYRKSTWFLNPALVEEPHVTWTVMSPAGVQQPVINSFTDSVAVVYPFLNDALSKLQYHNTVFTRSEDGHTYSERIENLFLRPGSSYEVREYYTVTK